MECREDEVRHGCHGTGVPEGHLQENAEGTSKEKKEMEEINRCLLDDGLSAEASPEERQRHLWRLLRRCEDKLMLSARELQSVRAQRAHDMEEVENYVEHIRNLLDDRESLASEYEQENEQLRVQLRDVALQQDIQLKELAEMLEQEGLAEISHSSPSEQVAYLLVERATLLEKLEAADRKLGTLSLADSLKEVPLQDGSQPSETADCQTSWPSEEQPQQQKGASTDTKNGERKERLPPDQSPWKKLFGVRKTSKGPKKGVSARVEEPREGEWGELRRLRRDLDEASRRLAMAHEEIRRLTDELDSARKARGQQESELLWATEESEQLQRELDQLRENGNTELERAKQKSERLELENRALAMRVENMKMSRVEPSPGLAQGASVAHSAAPAAVPGDTSNEQSAHKRCLQDLEDRDCRLRELQRQLRKRCEEQEELVERNEELEALLGEAQNQSKAERERHEGEMEGLHKKIKRLEGRLAKAALQEPSEKNGNCGDESKACLSQERVELLESHLVEEKEWRKQLEVDLAKVQEALKKAREELQRDQDELKASRQEVERLRAECQRPGRLSFSWAQVNPQKDGIEEKVFQSPLECSLDPQVSVCGQAQEDPRESRKQTAEPSTPTVRPRSQVSRPQKGRDSSQQCLGRITFPYSEEMSTSTQEQWRQQKQELWLLRGVGQAAESMFSHAPSADTPVNDSDSQSVYLRVQISHLQSTLEEERLLAGQHQMALLAQVAEAQAKAKAQESLLQQKTEESRQLRQDLQRVQSLFTSAERELRYEREKNLDLKRHNTLLDQEKIKLSAELKQVQAKVTQMEQNAAAQAAKVERLQQRACELELELGCSGQARQAQSSLQEELNAERLCLAAADKKVLELQQQLKGTLHQLKMVEARSAEANQLERDSREMSDTLGQLRAKLKEEELQRKVLEQRGEELREQVCASRAVEAACNRANLELGRRLAVLEGEYSATSEELRLSQAACHKLQDQAASTQQESERLKEELQMVLKQLDTQIKKHSEKQWQHKARLRRAKQAFRKETALLCGRVQKLEDDLALAERVSEKEQDCVKRVMVENEKLLLEVRDLLRRLKEAEDASADSRRMASTALQRMTFMETENKQLQERVLMLFSQVGALERALRNVQPPYGTEDVKKICSPESLKESFLDTSQLSVVGVSDALGFLDAINMVKAGSRMGGALCPLSTVDTPASEIGYLNVTSSLDPECGLDHEGTLSVDSDET